VVEKSIHRRLVAILVADVVGYSRMMEADEAGTYKTLKQRRSQVLDPLVKAHGGRIVKLMGDGVLVEFASAVEAVEAAIELQRKMKEANANVAKARQILLRIGINMGDVIGEGSDIYGEGVNIAARLETLAEPGGICMSEKVHNEIQGKIPIVMKDLGLVQLKNITAPVRTFGMETARPLAEARPSRGKEFTTIAVLPFTNMSGSADQDYFADGITEDMTTELSRFRNLSVVARNTTLGYRGQSVNAADVGRELGADFVLEGSVRLAGQRMRASVQLIEAQSGAHVFSERFDREMADIFSVQDEIVEAIVARLFSICKRSPASFVPEARRRTSPPIRRGCGQALPGAMVTNGARATTCKRRLSSIRLMRPLSPRWRCFMPIGGSASRTQRQMPNLRWSARGLPPGQSLPTRTIHSSSPPLPHASCWSGELTTPYATRALRSR